MRSTVLLFILAVTAMAVQGQAIDLNDGQIQEVKKIIAVFSTKDKAKIADFIQYPLRREYPLKDVKDRSDFIKRFDEIFDKGFVNHIGNSKLTNWSEVGWRGVMLDRGSVWLGDGGKIKAVNYQSPKEKVLLANAIFLNKSQLPENLRNFEKPKYLIETKNYQIRIDQTGEGSYRYASWKVNAEEENPELVVNKGGPAGFQGSGAYGELTFKNGAYNYIVLTDPYDMKASLIVEKDGKRILKEEGVIKRN